MQKYSFKIEWSKDDSEYVATCPSFQGLSAFGETEEDALKEAKIALALFIESYKERGISLPEPQSSQAFSGQIRLRLPKSLHQRATRMASDDGISLNQYITNALNREVSGEEVAIRFGEELRNINPGLAVRVSQQVHSHPNGTHFVNKVDSTPNDYVN